MFQNAFELDVLESFHKLEILIKVAGFSICAAL